MISRDRSGKLNKRTGFVAVILMIAMCMSLAACGKDGDGDKDESPSIKANQVTLYRATGTSIEKDKDYLLKQPDSFNASIEELIPEFEKKDGINILSYEPDESNNVTFYISDEKKHSAEELMLFNAALVNTFSQLSGMGTITIALVTTDGDDQNSVSNVSSVSYEHDSFFFYDHEEAYLNKDTVTLYLPNSSGRKLRRVISDIQITGDDSMEMAVLKLLKKYNVFSDDTDILNVFTRGGVCYIDFSDDFLEDIGRNSAEVVVYSIVDSLTNMRGINSVRIYIEGKDEGNFRGEVDLSDILVFEGGILE